MNNLGNYFTVRNGYLHVTETDLPERNTHKYRKLMMNTYVCYHKDIQVTSGFRTSEGLTKVANPEQKVDQVFVAAINIQQGEVGISNASQPNIEKKCKFILDYAYQSTYIGAIYHQRNHIFLTLVGGGAFGNNKKWIYEALITAHKKWGQKNKSAIQHVSLILYNPSDFEEQLIDLLKHHDIDYNIQML
uniref:Macro domain-containing protein n=1 Tax=Arcella intermedia TaxID=1963864 RepID=A0A6B2LGJ6_9EUKA